ncbi:alkylated DNA repair protein AlkB [Cryptococcus floricola]|uniref:Alkylated DNA repair protein AlkB n=1 Tax=Cryptococcus floricola TaxID=2591691 RepID=A0A5D3AYR9_9TREE|nr:alkylated DNA repair protein AlkB [Cryptococcus floricola]
MQDSAHSAFRLAEKHFKNRAHKDSFPSLRQWQRSLLDLSRPAAEEHDELWRAGWWCPDHDTTSPSSAKRSKKTKAKDKGHRPEQARIDLTSLELPDGKVGYVVADGCILIPGYLSKEEQLTYALESLAEYTLPPNPLSLSTHYDLPQQGLFDLLVNDPVSLILPKHMTIGSEGAVSGSPTSQPKNRVLNDTEPASVIGYDEIVARNKGWKGDAPSEKLGCKRVEQLYKEIRWANLGWVYQWSTKSYDFSRETPIPFPKPLADLCSSAVAAIPWQQVFDPVKDPQSANYGWESWPGDYRPDTGIVNFYQLNDTLMAHVDRAELDPVRPLVSLSLGHAAILLLGSDSRDDTPRPIVLRSGDMLIMSGRGRQAYHGETMSDMDKARAATDKVQVSHAY